MKVYLCIITLVSFGCNAGTGDVETQQSIIPQQELPREVITYLGDFTVNLNDPNAGHLLQMTIAVESERGVAKIVEAKMPQIRDNILLYSSEYTARSLKGMDGKMNLKDELKLRVNKILDEDIDRMHFVRFTISP
jgi:flagellar basal body-associated protein FliL